MPLVCTIIHTYVYMTACMHLYNIIGDAWTDFTMAEDGLRILL